MKLSKQIIRRKMKKSKQIICCFLQKSKEIIWNARLRAFAMERLAFVGHLLSSDLSYCISPAKTSSAYLRQNHASVVWRCCPSDGKNFVTNNRNIDSKARRNYLLYNIRNKITTFRNNFYRVGWRLFPNFEQAKSDNALKCILYLKIMLLTKTNTLMYASQKINF